MNTVSRLQHLCAGLHARIGFHSIDQTSRDKLSIGIPAIDQRLGGGLARAALHEVFAAMSDDGVAAAAFALLLGLRAFTVKSVIWVRECREEKNVGRLHAPGLAELGVDLENLIIVTASDALGVLRAGADIVSCGAVGVLLLEPQGRAASFNLTASRRLALSAARSGVTTLIVRTGAEPAPSAAQTRWQVGAAPSRALLSNAPWLPAFDVSLLRHREGIAGFDARVEWDRDRRSFREAPVSSSVPAVPARRTGVEIERRAA